MFMAELLCQSGAMRIQKIKHENQREDDTSKRMVKLSGRTVHRSTTFTLHRRCIYWRIRLCRSSSEPICSS